ncbi:MAG: DUF4492 domain-containing protein [Muribaculaceae bacterium]|nr:DUF4492 domain-containing protein [Muribaculaceae bacterium]
MTIIKRIYDFYHDGFASMTVGRSLWLIILIKLAIIFLVLKIFFFPDFLSSKSRETGASEASLVKSELLNRSTR